MRPLAPVRLLFGSLALLLVLPALARPQLPPAPGAAGDVRQLTVAALELPSRDDAQWKQRREQVLQLLTELQPDVISVQQVLQELPNQLLSNQQLLEQLQPLLEQHRYLLQLFHLLHQGKQ